MPAPPDHLPAWDVPGAEESPFPAVAAEMASRLNGDSSGHDLAHSWRVFDLGRTIAATEGADPTVVGLASLVHDYHRVVNGTAYVHPEETLDDVAALLADASVDDAATVDAVCHCVAVHDDFAYQGDPDRIETVEAAVLQDADNLDAIGAVGIGRTFAFGGDRGFPMWAPGDEEDPSTIGHCYEKLLRIDEELNTDAAREIAADRMAFLEDFVERFEREWYGER